MTSKNVLSLTPISTTSSRQDMLVVDWQLLESCNYACEYCHLENPNKQEIFSRGRVLGIARRLLELGRPAYLFRITGGEPTLHPYFPELVRFLFHAGKSVRLIFDTNGSRKPNYYQTVLYSAPPASVRVDLSVHVGKTSPEQLQGVIEAVVAAGQGCHVQFLYIPELADMARRYHAALTALRASLPFTLETTCLVQLDSGIIDNAYTASDRVWLAEAEKTFARAAEQASVIAPDFDWLGENTLEAVASDADYLCLGATYLHIDAQGMTDGGVSLSGKPVRRIDAANEDFEDLAEIVESAKSSGDEDVLALIPRFRHEQEARDFLADFRSRAENWRRSAGSVPDPLHPEPTAEHLVSVRLRRLDAAYGLAGETERLSDVAKVYAALVDERSRDVYLRCLRAWQCGDASCLAPVDLESADCPAQQGVALSSAQACLDVPLGLLDGQDSCRLRVRQRGAGPTETFVYAVPTGHSERSADDPIPVPFPVLENRISVIIPVHNNADTLRRCLDSVLVQDVESLEIIVVDGASTDKSPEILAEYQRRYPEIVRVIRLAANRGPGLNRNIGIELATGAGIAFLDSDDALVEQALSRGMEVLRAEQADSVVFDMRLVALDGTQSHVGVEESVYSGKEAFFFLLMEKLGGWSTNNRLYRTTFLREQHIRYSEIVVHHDLLFNIPATFYADKIVVLPEIGYTRYARKNAVSDRDNGKSQVVALAVAVRFLDRFFAEHGLDVSAPSYVRCVRRLYALNRACLFATTRKADRDGEKPPLSNQRLRHLGESREWLHCLLEEGAILAGIRFKNGSHVVLDAAPRSWKKDDFSLDSGAGDEQSRSLFHGETAGANTREGQYPDILTLKSSGIFSEESTWTCIPYGQADAPASVAPIFSFIFPDDGIVPSPESCLKSLFSDFADGFEVIVTSAADEGRVASIMDYADLFANVRLYRLPGASRRVCGRVGLEKARGEYVFFLDEKDRVFPLFLNEARAAVKNSNADVVCFAVREITPDGMLLRYTPLEQSLLDARQAIKRTLEDETFQIPYGVLIRTALLREAGSAVSDDPILPNAAMWIRVLSHAKVILTYPCIACDRVVTEQEEKAVQRISHEDLRASCSLYAAWQSVADVWSQDEELVALVHKRTVERLREKFLPQLAVFRQALGHIPLTASEYALLSQAPMFLSNLVLECARFQEIGIPEGLLSKLPAWSSFLFRACAQPVITVIIPVHNQENAIAACLQSVREQTLFALEILIMDDASTDLTLALCRDYAARDGRIVVHSADTRLGDGVLCARALEQARGQYVLFLAPSETLPPNVLLRASVLLTRHLLVDVVLCALDNAPDQECFFTREQWLERICADTEQCAWRLTGKVFRRELLCRTLSDFVPGLSERDEGLWRVYAAARGLVYSPDAAYGLQELSRPEDVEQHASPSGIQRLLRLAETFDSLTDENALATLHELFLTTRLFPRLKTTLSCLGRDIGKSVLPLTTLPLVSLANCSRLWPLALNDCATLYARQTTWDKRLALEDADTLGLKGGENQLIAFSTPPDGEEPHLSIVILARNVVETLSGCLDSILSQGTAGVEILLADNASEDATLLLCREYATRVSCIRLFRTVWKSGKAALRTLLLEQVRGAYVLFIEPEHRLEPHFLPNVLALLEAHPNCGAFVFGHTILDTLGDLVLAQCNYADEEPDAEEWLRRVVESPTEAGLLWNKVFKTSVIREQGLSFSSDQPVDILLALHVYTKTNVRTTSILAIRHPQTTFPDTASEKDFTTALAVLTGIESFFYSSGLCDPSASALQAAECVRACFREGLADALFDYPALCQKNGYPSPFTDEVATKLAAFPALAHGLLMLYAALAAGVQLRQTQPFLSLSERREPVFIEPSRPNVLTSVPVSNAIKPDIAPPAELALFDGENLVDKELWNTDPKTATVLALQRSGFFDSEYYLRTYPDVVASGMNPVEHYVCHGAEEGRSPAPWYDEKKSWNVEASIQREKVIPFWRYLFNGSQRSFIKKIDISVIIPVYNAEKYICRGLDSILKQTLKNIEIILFEDCSKDNSLKIIEKYAKEYNNIKIITSKHNVGQGKGRNEALKYASGEYITFLDSDDYYFDDEYFHFLLQTAKNTKSDIVVTPYIREKSGELKFDDIKEEYISGENAAYKFISREFGTHAPGGKLFRAHILSKNTKFVEYGFSQDVLFSFRAFLNATKICVVKRHGYVYYNDNVSSWRPISITKKHIFSSIRLFIEILCEIFYCANKGISIDCSEFIKTWRKDHDPRLLDYFKKTSKNDLFANNILLFLDNEKDFFINLVISKELKTIFKNSHKNSKVIKNHFFDFGSLSYLQSKKQELKSLINTYVKFKSKSSKREKIVIYVSHLSAGGLEKVATQLGNALLDFYDIFYILDDTSRITYKHCGTVLKANLWDINVLENLHNAKFIFDFKYKKIDDEYPICSYCVKHFPYKYIATIHNTETCKDYFHKIKEYLGEKDTTSLHSIVCVSNAVKDKFISLYGNTKNISVLYNPVDFDAINHTSPVGMNNEKFILFAGRLNATKHKGIDILVKSFHFSNISDRCKLVLAGTGKLEKEVTNYIKDNNLENKIITLGFKENIYGYMKQAEFLVAPSRWEGFSLVLIESLACGTPVLVTPVGGAPEVIQHKKNGYLINKENIQETALGMEYLFANAYKMRINCITSVKKFSLIEYKKKILQEIIRII